MRKIIAILLVSLGIGVYAQTSSDKAQKLGIKTSINLSKLTGDEFENPTIKFGYTAGAFYQFEFSDPWFLHTEFLGNFQGSNFNNADDEYTRISLFYLDAPLLLGYHFKDKAHSISVGPYGSYLGLSSMFIGGKRKAHLNDLDLKPYDYGVALYYQMNGKLMSFQTGVKAGMNNINNGIKFVDINPATGNNGTINNLSFEIGMLF
jgi:hypothetical protein